MRISGLLLGSMGFAIMKRRQIYQTQLLVLERAEQFSKSKRKNLGHMIVSTIALAWPWTRSNFKAFQDLIKLSEYLLALRRLFKLLSKLIWHKTAGDQRDVPAFQVDTCLTSMLIRNGQGSIRNWRTETNSGKINSDIANPKLEIQDRFYSALQIPKAPRVRRYEVKLDAPFFHHQHRIR